MGVRQLTVVSAVLVAAAAAALQMLTAALYQMVSLPAVPQQLPAVALFLEMPLLVVAGQPQTDFLFPLSVVAAL